jgi:hypothetical protein
MAIPVVERQGRYVVGVCYLGGVSTFYPTYFMVFTFKSLSRKNLQYEGAFEHQHAQTSDEAGHYLISR